jgi:hypothetical protein
MNMLRNQTISLFTILCILLFSSEKIVAACIVYPDSTLNSTADFDPFQDFFDTETPLEIRLKFDIKNFQRTNSQEKYHSALLTAIDTDSCEYEYPVRLKTRGIFRKSYCTTPPFWLNITESGIDSEAFDGMKKMKVVPHCLNKEFYHNYVLKEYLAYKIYNIISPYSFRTRLLRITYIDEGRKNKETVAWAFAIEPKKMMAERLDATLVENNYLSMKYMDPDIMDHLALFDYMIGNTDYSITGLHNIKLIKLNNAAQGEDPEGYIPVPYDFDFTGFVNTIYAKPANNARIGDVTSRYYTGPCRSDLIFEQLLKDFRNHRDGIHDLLQPFEYLHLKDKMEMLRFIESFFNEVASDDFIDWRIRNSCL